MPPPPHITGMASQQQQQQDYTVHNVSATGGMYDTAPAGMGQQYGHQQFPGFNATYEGGGNGSPHRADAYGGEVPETDSVSVQVAK